MKTIAITVIDDKNQVHQRYHDNLKRNPHFNAKIQLIDSKNKELLSFIDTPTDCIIIAENVLQTNQNILTQLLRHPLFTHTAFIIAVERFYEAEVYNYLQQGCDAYIELNPASLAHLRLTVISAIEHKHMLAQKDENEKIYYKNSFLDPVTQLYNVRPFFEILHKSLSAAKRHGFNVGLLYIDLDDYTRVEQQYSHAISQQLLSLFGQRLLEVTRDEDVVGRIAENEFAVLATCPTNANDCNAIGQRLIDSLSQPFELFDNSINISANLGIAFSWDMHHNMESIIMDSTPSVVHAKQQGKGIFQMHFN